MLRLERYDYVVEISQQTLQPVFRVFCVFQLRLCVGSFLKFGLWFCFLLYNLFSGSLAGNFTLVSKDAFHGMNFQIVRVLPWL